MMLLDFLFKSTSLNYSGFFHFNSIIVMSVHKYVTETNITTVIVGGSPRGGSCV